MVLGEFAYLAIDLKTSDFVMVLRRLDSDRQLPIWIGNAEAFAIALAQADVKPPRPLTHDLLLDVIGALGGKLSRIVISGLKENTFYALLHIDRGDVETYVIDARPSDSVALALRAKCPIFISEDIETFDLESPTDEVERELAERLKRLEPGELFRF